MNNSFLICDTKIDVARNVAAGLEALGFQCDCVQTGKEAQLKLYKKQYRIVILDINIQNHSSVEVLRYLKANYPQTKIVILTESKSLLTEIGLSSEDLSQLYITSIVRPYNETLILNNLNQKLKMSSWDLKVKSDNPLNEELTLTDSKFTEINIANFLDASDFCYDLYIKLSKNAYIKICNKGEALDHEQINRYIKDKNVAYLYFLTKDKAQFIAYLNDLTENVLKSKKYTELQQLDLVKKTAEYYIDEIYTQGINMDTLEEGKKVCDNIYKMVSGQPKIMDILTSLEVSNPAYKTHSFLTAFFSAIITRNLKWASKKTTETLLISSFLHDIGKLKLEDKIRNKKTKDLFGNDLAKFKNHPQLSLDMLQEVPYISGTIKQTIYQHHEYMNGSGYPNKLPGTKIFPLARIVCFASEFADFIIEDKLDIKKGLTELLNDKELIERYDPLIIKAFISGVIGK